MIPTFVDAHHMVRIDHLARVYLGFSEILGKDAAFEIARKFKQILEEQARDLKQIFQGVVMSCMPSSTYCVTEDPWPDTRFDTNARMRINIVHSAKRYTITTSSPGNPELTRVQRYIPGLARFQNYWPVIQSLPDGWVIIVAQLPPEIFFE